VTSEAITIVSGLPRSGTSMMMKMLEAGGLPVLTDEIRTADADNPRGYYEFERVKQIETDNAWLPEARGKAVKMIAALLKHLPPDYRYRVIFMQRKMEDLFAKHVQQVQSWLAEQPNFDVLQVDYNHVLQDPWPHVSRINDFLGGILDVERMAAVVEPGLYRQRRES